MKQLIPPLHLIRKILTLLMITSALYGASAATLPAGEHRTVILTCDPDVRDYTPAVRRILEEHPDGNLELAFEKGTYHFFPEGASERYLSVSNNDNGLKRIAFDLSGLNGITVDGNGAEFILHGRLVAFSAEGSGEITLKDFSIDYAEPFIFEAEVIASDADKRKITVKVHPDCRYEIDDSRIYFYGHGWRSGLGVNTLFDKSTRRPYFNTDRYYQHSWKNQLSAKSIGKDTLELTGVNSELVPPVGSIITDKGYANRLVPGIAIRDCHDIVIKDVDVYHSGAMALIAEYSENLTLERYNVLTREDSGRMISSTADASHFTDCKGKIILRDCRFESMLDDAANVHGTYMKVESLVSDSLLVASFGHVQQEGNLFAKAGDRIRFIDRKTLRPVAEAIVKGIRRVNANWYEIRFGEKIPVGDTDCRPEETAIENISRGADVRISGCRVRYNRARSFLISTSGDVVIEDCYLSSMMAGIRISGDANFWYESGNTRNVLIRKNRFEDLGINGGFPQAILQIDPVIPKDARTDGFRYHRRIVFEDNDIQTFDAQVVYACSVAELVIRNNRFRDSGTHDPLYGELSTIDLQFCGKVCIEGNDFSAWGRPAEISLHRCKDTAALQEDMQTTDHPNPFFFEN